LAVVNGSSVQKRPATGVATLAGTVTQMMVGSSGFNREDANRGDWSVPDCRSCAGAFGNDSRCTLPKRVSALGRHQWRMSG